MDDPDAPAGMWVPWVLYDLPADAKELPERVPRQEPHRYFFKLYALDTKLNLKSGATKADLERAMSRARAQSSCFRGR